LPRGCGFSSPPPPPPQGTNSSASSLTATPLPIHLQYTNHVTSFTNEGHNCALVYNGGLVMVFRADTIGEHYLWLRALRSRLLPESTVDIAVAGGTRLAEG
jgi:hypothetical protein